LAAGDSGLLLTRKVAKQMQIISRGDGNEHPKVQL
jgi:hypothetical protein